MLRPRPGRTPRGRAASSYMWASASHQSRIRSCGSAHGTGLRTARPPASAGTRAPAGRRRRAPRTRSTIACRAASRSSASAAIMPSSASRQSPCGGQRASPRRACRTRRRRPTRRPRSAACRRSASGSGRCCITSGRASSTLPAPSRMRRARAAASRLSGSFVERLAEPRLGLGQVPGLRTSAAASGLELGLGRQDRVDEPVQLVLGVGADEHAHRLLRRGTRSPSGCSGLCTACSSACPTCLASTSSLASRNAPSRSLRDLLEHRPEGAGTGRTTRPRGRRRRARCFDPSITTCSKVSSVTSIARLRAHGAVSMSHGLQAVSATSACTRDRHVPARAASEGVQHDRDARHRHRRRGPHRVEHARTPRAGSSPRCRRRPRRGSPG